MSDLNPFALETTDKAITVFAPHPDDEVFGCGGLIGLLAQEGRKLRIIVVSDGAFGEFGRDPAARKRESLAAGKILSDAQIEFWDLPDQGLAAIHDLPERFHDELTTTPAQLLLIPSPWEVHPDHLAVCRAACTAWRMLDAPPQLFFYEVGTPMPRPFVIDITQIAEKKRQAMACFASQNAIQDYAGQIAGLNAYRGYTLGRHGAWGEAYFRPSPKLLQAQGEEMLASLLVGEGVLTPARREHEMDVVQDALAKLIQENQELHAECAALRQSTSWRLTAPLRTLARWFRLRFLEP